MKFLLLVLCLLASILTCSIQGGAADHRLPTLYLIGDSTVKNGTRGLVGWGTPIAARFDAARITVANRALGGRSSRSYLREGLWDKVVEKLQPGDFVIMQFGHNDGGPMDSGRARASIRGNGDESSDVLIRETGVAENVHSYGWYLRKYISDTKAKGATPIVCSLIPRNMWKEGYVTRSAGDYGKWAKEAAEQEGALFIDLNEIVAARYEAIGAEKVMDKFFTEKDHTHTTAEGAEFNADAVIEGIRSLKGCELGDFIVQTSETIAN